MTNNFLCLLAIKESFRDISVIHCHSQKKIYSTQFGSRLAEFPQSQKDDWNKQCGK